MQRLFTRCFGRINRMKYIELSAPGNVRMPLVGLGTWRAQPQETEGAVETALRVGYRLIGKFPAGAAPGLTEWGFRHGF